MTIKQETLDKIQTATGIFVTASIGVAICVSVPRIHAIKHAQAADYVWKMADANRIASLAKKYDASTAALQIKEFATEIAKNTSKI